MRTHEPTKNLLNQMIAEIPEEVKMQCDMSDTIAGRIDSILKERGMTQKQFAEKLGVSYQSVSRWENEETYPDMELLPAIAVVFGISVDTLMGIEEIEKEKQATDVFDSLRREAMMSAGCRRTSTR